MQLKRVIALITAVILYFITLGVVGFCIWYDTKPIKDQYGTVIDTDRPYLKYMWFAVIPMVMSLGLTAYALYPRDYEPDN